MKPVLRVLSIIFLALLFLTVVYEHRSLHNFEKSRDVDLSELLERLDNDKKFISESVRLHREARNEKSIPGTVSLTKFQDQIEELEMKLESVLKRVAGEPEEESEESEEQSLNSLRKRVAELEVKLDALKTHPYEQTVTEPSALSELADPAEPAPPQRLTPPKDFAPDWSSDEVVETQTDSLSPSPQKERLAQFLAESRTQPPTEAPTEAPTETPTEAPTKAPTEAPTEAPTKLPNQPTIASTLAPTPPSVLPPISEIHRPPISHHNLPLTPRVQDPASCPAGYAYSPHCQTCMKTERRYTDKINYVHIPRAAGSSFTVPVRSYLQCGPVGKGCWGTPAITVEGNVDCGGKLVGCYGLNPLRNRNSVVMLREPISRVRSSFADKQYPGGTTEEKAKVKTISSFKEYLAVPGISNCQTKVLNGKSCVDKGPIGEAEIAKAFEKIETIDMFGLVEHYRTSVCLLFQTFGGLPVDSDFTMQKKNYSYRPQVPLAPPEKNAAQESEAADLVVYEHAKKIFEERLREHNQPYVD